MNFRMFPPANPSGQSINVNGRAYAGTPGTPITVPDFDGQQLQANGWSLVALSGPTSGRPTQAPGLYQAVPGMKFYDETLSAIIVFDGAAWRNPITGAVV